MHISELETPAVIVDLDVMERNLSRVADYCRTHHLLLRPHTKTHKIPELAKRQIASGATGITVAKLGEAEVMRDAGIDDILIAYPIVGPEKTARLARIAERARIRVSLDSIDAARGISAAAARQGSKIGILIEMDVGFERCGLSNERDLVNLAFWGKMSLLFISLLLLAFFQSTLVRSVAIWEETPSGRSWAQVLAVLSILMWVAIVILGRWIAYAQIEVNQ